MTEGRETTPGLTPEDEEQARLNREHNARIFAAAAGRDATPVDGPEQHDGRCEAGFITGPMAYSPCGCAERAAGREAKRDYGICPACLVDEGAPCVNDQQRPVPWIHEGRAVAPPARET